MAVKPVKKMVIKDGGDSYIMCSPFEDAVDIYDPNKQGGYMYDDYVYYAEAEGTIGHIYHCKKNNTTAIPTDTTKWELVTVTGELVKIMERLYQNPVVSKLSFNSPVSGIALMGNTVSYNDIILSYELNKDPQVMTINTKTVDSPQKSGTIKPKEGSWEMSDSSLNRRMTIAFTDEKEKSASKYVTLSFVNYIYWGVAELPDNLNNVDSDFINSLPSTVSPIGKKLTGSRAVEISVDAGNESANKRIWFAIPLRLDTEGNCVFENTVTGFKGGFANSITTVYVKNDSSSEYSEKYRIYYSDQVGLGVTNLSIT